MASAVPVHAGALFTVFVLLICYIWHLVPPAQSVYTGADVRPTFHFLPEHNWMNDPNGPMFWNGLYHLFYQYNPGAAVWGDMHWGHAVAPSLAGPWRHLPLALFPERGSYDQNGVFSGSATLTAEGPVLMYTGISPNGTESQCIARPADIRDPELVRWVKDLHNPVIPFRPPGTNITCFRDPTTCWRDSIDGFWRVLIGSGIQGSGGAALLYESPDLVHWTYKKPIFRVPATEGFVWECPDLIDFGSGKYGMKVSLISDRHDWWYTGRYDERTEQFVARTRGLLDGGGLYASKSFRAEDGRPVLWGWIPEADSEDSYVIRGWAGVMSLPREVKYLPDDTLAFMPVREMETLRRHHTPLSGLSITGVFPLNVTGNTLEIRLRFSLDTSLTATSFGVRVLASPCDREYTDVLLTIPDTFLYPMNRPEFLGMTPSLAVSTLRVDRIHSSRSPDTDTRPRIVPLPTLPVTHTAELRVFVDHSVIEAFAFEGRGVVATRVYPTLDASSGVALLAYGGRVSLHDGDVWEVDRICTS